MESRIIALSAALTGAVDPTIEYLAGERGWSVPKRISRILIPGIGATWATITGNPVSFSAKAAPLKSLSLSLSPIQSLNGYSNPWPAGGGKNKWVPCSDQTVGNVTFTWQADGSVKLNGLCNSSAVATVSATLPSGTYTLSCGYSGSLPNNSSSRAQVYNSQWYYYIKNNDASNASVTFTLAESATVEFRFRVDNGFNYQNVIYYPQLEMSETPTSFSPYSNICPISGWTGVDVFVKPAYDAGATPTVSISFPTPPGTVYSGTLDVLTGVLTVDKAYIKPSTMTPSAQNAGNYGYGKNYNLPFNVIPRSSSGQTTGAITSMGFTERGYYYNTIARIESNTDFINEHPNQFVFPSSGSGVLIYAKGTTAETFDTHIADLEICYPIVEQTYQLTPQEVSSLLGQNVVWSDANGDLTVEYRSN
jgi:hypothetical protein